MRNWKNILWLSIPSVASFATGTVTGTVNLIMVGQLGVLAIAIVGVCNIIMYNVWGFISGIGHTVNYLVAQNYGANDSKKAVERTHIALYLCLFIGLFVFLLGTFGAGWLLKLMGGSSELIQQGEDYLRIRFWAMIFSTLSFVFHGFMRGIGDTKTPMVFSITSNALMIFFTYTLTYGKWGLPELGLPGAAWSIFIGELVGLIGCILVYFVKLHPQFHTRAVIPINRQEAKLISWESFKLGGQELALALSMFIFTMFVTRLGTVPLAANEIALSVMAFGFMPAFAFGSTATILVGQYIGKGNAQMARRMGTETATIGSLFILLLGLVEFLLAEPIARIYTTDPDVYHLAAFLIEISAFLQVFDGLLNFYAGGLRGIGDTGFLFKTSLVLCFAMFVPLTYLLTFVFGLNSVGAWISLYTFLMAFGIIVMIRFYKVDWAKVMPKSTEA
ncbi:MATE family efflux transporter [Brevibacillus fluminis]|uniref:Probable multidrug resistance protein NorM n=1 Tax=Brevibacillus fluminis TaxID=511487 RepID=A0A3M8D6G2_9BACL|nr:MATE family efflux transporter [Brevibacillus fluminis]RNB83309.1 MATE family efflux transporter [Brevibacillus fluminis]